MAGIWAGRTASSAGATPAIALLEGSSKLGRKILISGGGRCNVTNREVSALDYAGASQNAIKKVLKRFGVPETVSFFQDLGIEFKIEEDTGKLFPTTDRARTVLDSLTSEAREFAEIYYPCRVEAIERAGDRFVVSGPWGAMAARAVVLATGGKSIPKTGSDGHGFELAKELGHSLTPHLFPALVPLTLPKNHFVNSLSGTTLVTAFEVWNANGKRLWHCQGSTLCTHFGLSGPAALDVSRHYLAAVQADPSSRLTVNWAPNWNEEQLTKKFRDESKRLPATVVRELVPDRLGKMLLEQWLLDPVVPAESAQSVCKQLSKKAIRALVQLVTRCPLPLTGTRGFGFAEATAGGVPLTEIELSRMESRLCPGLFLCGEICDVDGRIGGFNFQWAWSSGYVAGLAVGSSFA